MTKHPGLFAMLAAPFEAGEVKKLPKGGRQLDYITARTAMNRLDEVLGPENWWDEYVPSENSVLCRLTIRLPDGTTLTKCDAGGYAGMSDSGDDDKSGYSDAFKRAAAKFGVARYLYKDGVPDFGSYAEPQPPTEKDLAVARREIWQWATDLVPVANAWWLKALAAKGREAPAGHEAILQHECHLLNHLVKWARDGRGLELPEGFGFKPTEVVETLAPLWIADARAIEDEAWHYVKKVRPGQVKEEVDRKTAKAGGGDR